MCLSGAAAAMASIDPWRLCQGEIRPAFPQRTALGTGERVRESRREGEREKEEENWSTGWSDGVMKGGCGGRKEG